MHREQTRKEIEMEKKIIRAAKYLTKVGILPTSEKE